MAHNTASAEDMNVRFLVCMEAVVTISLASGPVTRAMIEDNVAELMGGHPDDFITRVEILEVTHDDGTSYTKAIMSC